MSDDVSAETPRVTPATRAATPAADALRTRMTEQLGIALPIIGGAMYPCSNPELVAAVSEAGGIGVLQPVSLTYVHGHDFRDGIRYMRTLTQKPLGMNALIEGNSRVYRERMTKWIAIALEEGVRFFVTSLGKPDWVVRMAEDAGAVVYHDVTERKWADKAMDSGVHGLIAVNDRAGGHAGPKSAERLLDELAPLGLPVICAGGIGDPQAFARVMRLGYDGVQLGTRLIATTECTASDAYKAAIVDAGEDDIVLSERITGVPLAVIRTPYVERVGTRAGWFARRMLKGRRTKHWMRTWFAVRSAMRLRKASLDPKATQDYWQAGKSVAGVTEVLSVAEVMASFAEAARGS
ncbi:MAG TPA: nitronate monooxygenase [Longimicrobiales bacterium]|nr:nitronate monooxygenase [Longimicrobiales bacterium]